MLGAYDVLQHPKNISETAKKNVCFFMFVDEITEEFLRNSSGLDNRMKLGLWKIVVIRNLPFTDPRRNGKVKSRSNLLVRVNYLDDLVSTYKVLRYYYSCESLGRCVLTKYQLFFQCLNVKRLHGSAGNVDSRSRNPF